MSIASEIQRIQSNITNAYTACNNKGATIPATQNSANLATCINSISTDSNSSYRTAEAGILSTHFAEFAEYQLEPYWTDNSDRYKLFLTFNSDDMLVGACLIYYTDLINGGSAGSFVNCIEDLSMQTYAVLFDYSYFSNYSYSDRAITNLYFSLQEYASNGHYDGNYFSVTW